jgi:hypothetical protein
MLIVERFEDNIAILEDSDTGKHVEVDKSRLPGAKESDVVIKRDGFYVVDSEATEERRARIIGKLRKLGM